MSATNRGSQRVESDYYATPKSAFEPLLPYLKKLDRFEFWEPACGDGRLINWMREAELLAFGDDISNGCDFLEDQREYDCIVTNPPYSLAFEFCQHANTHADHVFLLLRLNFLASQERRPWFQAHEPSALFVLSKRPSFTPDGKTDATDYAWFGWTPACKGIYHL